MELIKFPTEFLIKIILFFAASIIFLSIYSAIVLGVTCVGEPPCNDRSDYFVSGTTCNYQQYYSSTCCRGLTCSICSGAKKNSCTASGCANPVCVKNSCGAQCTSNSDCPSGTCDTSTCTCKQPICGNKIINTGEECDPPGSTQSQTCSYSATGGCNYVGGTQSRTCQSNCKWGAWSSCSGGTLKCCGNGVINFGEECDPPGTVGTCNIEGKAVGQRSCDSNCKWTSCKCDYNTCYAYYWNTGYCNTTDNMCYSYYCQPVWKSGSPSQKLDILFIGEDYSSESLYNTQVNEHANKILEFSPFKEYKNRINIWKVGKSIDDLGCSRGAMTCDVNKILKYADKCYYDVIPSSTGQHNSIIVLLDDSWPYTDRAWTVSDYATAIGPLPKSTIHELGHVMGLCDEYSPAKPYDGEGLCPNCDTSPQLVYVGYGAHSYSNWLPYELHCKWYGTPGTGCYQGCDSSSGYRPTNFILSSIPGTPTSDCIMGSGPDLLLGDVVATNYFCPVCKNYLINVLNTYR